MENRFDYYYGNEAEQFRYYQIPKELLDNSAFSSLSLDAKILYAVLRDRMQLSKANSWIDEKQRIYIVYSIESISQKLGIGTDKSIRLLKELECFGLVEKRRRGQGLNSLLYIKNFAAYDHQNGENAPVEVSDNPSHDSCKELNKEVKAMVCPIGNISEFGKTEFKKSENQNSGNRENRILEVGKTESNDLKENNPKENDPEGSNHSFNPSPNTSIQTERLNESRPSIVLGINEKLSTEDRRHLEAVLTEHKGIPWTMVNCPELMKKMMMHIGCWKEIYLDKHAQDSVTIHRVVIECLTEMALEKSPWSCKGSMITYRPVIERINCTLQETNGQLLYGLIDRVIDKYLDASLDNYIQNPKQYLKAIIWEELYAAQLESDTYYRKRIHDDFG
ncbi:MAG: replication initiator protein A [Paludibacteraceae bacterium]|nr:replication initiator protein A [Paludibacteraceae bacterium]